ncbi:MAG: hypothetical protein CMH64_02945 [Nanoarchaeota archaeon]|jgi:hypothetical protein|nr:hypothetical protein [Nanoarchaeota archaeon]|tara:strand:+ start:186 stop:434 length:249 start_codon:yes stop_codon:yes gene_type:complete
MTLANDLTALKDRIESQITKKIKLQGQKEECFKYLNEKFACNNLKEGENLYKKLDRRKIEMVKEIENKILKLDNILSEFKGT